TDETLYRKAEMRIEHVPVARREQKVLDVRHADGVVPLHDGVHPQKLLMDRRGCAAVEHLRTAAGHSSGIVLEELPPGRAKPKSAELSLDLSGKPAAYAAHGRAG